MKQKNKKFDLSACQWLHQLPLFLLNMLAGKGLVSVDEATTKAGDELPVPIQGRKWPQTLAMQVNNPGANFEIQKYYQNEYKSNVVYSKNDLPKVKDGAYVINLEQCK